MEEEHHMKEEHQTGEGTKEEHHINTLCMQEGIDKWMVEEEH